MIDNSRDETTCPREYHLLVAVGAWGPIFGIRILFLYSGRVWIFGRSIALARYMARNAAGSGNELDDGSSNGKPIRRWFQWSWWSCRKPMQVLVKYLGVGGPTRSDILTNEEQSLAKGKTQWKDDEEGAVAELQIDIKPEALSQSNKRIQDVRKADRDRETATAGYSKM